MLYETILKVIKVWEFEERVEESLRKSHNSSWFAEEPGVLFNPARAPTLS